MTDHPLGPGHLAQIRNNYTNPSTKQGPLLTYLRTLGIDGEGADALPAVTGYDDADRGRLARQLHPDFGGARASTGTSTEGAAHTRAVPSGVTGLSRTPGLGGQGSGKLSCSRR